MQTKNIQYEFHINEFQITFNTAYSQQFKSKISHIKQLPREGVAVKNAALFISIDRQTIVRFFPLYFIGL